MHVLPPRIFTAVVVVTIVIIVALDRSRSILPESYSRGRCLGCGREPGGRGQKSKVGGEEGREGTVELRLNDKEKAGTQRTCRVGKE